MKICFDKTEDNEKLLEQLSLKKPSLEENKLCFSEEQIQKAGLNLEIFKILADEYGQDVSRFLASMRGRRYLRRKQPIMN